MFFHSPSPQSQEWQELSEAAEQEICFAEERIRGLQDVATQANENEEF